MQPLEKQHIKESNEGKSFFQVSSFKSFIMLQNLLILLPDWCHRMKADSSSSCMNFHELQHLAGFNFNVITLNKTLLARQGESSPRLFIVLTQFHVCREIAFLEGYHESLLTSLHICATICMFLFT